MANFIVEAKQVSGDTIRVYFDDGSVTHYYGYLKDFTAKAVITETSDGQTRAYFNDGTVRHYA